jgi:tetratricopeptide (TPR) repeat protein
MKSIEQIKKWGSGIAKYAKNIGGYMAKSLVFLSKVSQIIEGWARGIAALIFIIFALGIIIWIIYDMNSGYIEIRSVMVSPKLIEIGYDSEMISEMTLENINKIKKIGWEGDDIFLRYGSHTGSKMIKVKNKIEMPEVEIAKLGINLKSLARLIEELMGFDRKHVLISASLIGDSIEIYTMSYMGKNEAKFGICRSKMGDLDSLCESIALNIMETFQPIAIIRYYSETNRNRALDIIDKYFSRVDKKDVEELINLWGALLYLDRKYDEAIKKFKLLATIAEDNETKAMAYMNWANCLGENGKNNEAIHKYWEAIELGEYLYVAYLDLALAYRIEGENDRAEIFFEKAIKKEPKMKDAYQDWSALLMDLKKYEKANELLSEAEKNVKLEALAYLMWGKALEKSNNKKEAIRKYIVAENKDTTGDVGRQAKDWIEELNK